MDNAKKGGAGGRRNSARDVISHSLIHMEYTNSAFLSQCYNQGKTPPPHPWGIANLEGQSWT